MKFKQVAARLTGFSVPIFGVQWNPPEPEITITKRVLAFLEDRRVLYNPYDIEILDYCARSVIEIRQFLTAEIGKLPVSDGELEDQLRAMRAACRRFLDTIQAASPPQVFHPHWNHGQQEFFTALGELRSAIGLRIGILAAMYGLDLEDDLATLLPPKDTK
jgi:hypothetical protein